MFSKNTFWSISEYSNKYNSQTSQMGNPYANWKEEQPVGCGDLSVLPSPLDVVGQLPLRHHGESFKWRIEHNHFPTSTFKRKCLSSGFFWFYGIKDSRTCSHLRVMADKCLHCLKEMFWGCDALQCCLNSRENYMPLWLWRLISVTHSSLASPAHFCNVCRWCRALCQSYLSTSSLRT